MAPNREIKTVPAQATGKNIPKGKIEGVRAKLGLRPVEPPDFLTKIELAERLRKTTRTIDAWVARGFLPHVKIGRAILFSWEAVEAHIKANFTVHGRGGIGGSR